MRIRVENKRQQHTRRLGVLSTDAEAPVVAETAVCADLFEALEVLAELRVDAVGEDLRVFAVDNVFLSVQEPGGDFELCGVLNDRDDTLEFIRVEVSSTITHIDTYMDTPTYESGTHRLLRSTSAFLQTMLA